MDVLAERLLDEKGTKVQIGIASWQHKYPESKCFSVRIYRRNSDGRFNKDGSPEVPISDLHQMVGFVTEQYEKVLTS